MRRIDLLGDADAPDLVRVLVDQVTCGLYVDPNHRVPGAPRPGG